MADANLPPALWEPGEELLERSAMAGYMRWLRSERGVVAESYEDLWEWSVGDLEGFWASIWDYFEVRASAPYERVLGSREMPGAEWFPGARLSYAEHVFRDRDGAEGAIRHASELRELEDGG